MRARPEEFNALILETVSATQNAAEAARTINARHGTKLTRTAVLRVAKRAGVTLTKGRAQSLSNLTMAQTDAAWRALSSERLKALWTTAEFRQWHSYGNRRKAARAAKRAAESGTAASRNATGPAPAP